MRLQGVGGTAVASGGVLIHDAAVVRPAVVPTSASKRSTAVSGGGIKASSARFMSTATARCVNPVLVSTGTASFASKAAELSVFPLITVGDSGNWNPFKQKGLLGMDRAIAPCCLLSSCCLPAGHADPTLLPARPTPITFKPAGFNDATGSPMHVADVDGHKFFLEDLALQQAKSWASGELGPGYERQKLVALPGPIKCGKSTLLKLLPRLLAPDSKHIPVVFEHAFITGEGPQQAALRLTAAVRASAWDFGFDIALLPTHGEAALADFARVMRDFANGIAAAGGELILLLDEVQAPVIAAASRTDAIHFASQLKSIHRDCRATSRIAITGSSMIAFLDAVRVLGPNGYSLWGAMTRVHLGATPAPVLPLPWPTPSSAAARTHDPQLLSRPSSGQAASSACHCSHGCRYHLPTGRVAACCPRPAHRAQRAAGAQPLRDSRIAGHGSI